jgi:hypothetical protein
MPGSICCSKSVKLKKNEILTSQPYNVTVDGGRAKGQTTADPRGRTPIGASGIGPSGVRALPLGVAAERIVHYIWY